MGSGVGCRKELNIIRIEFGRSYILLSDVVLLEICSEIIMLSKTDGGEFSSKLFGFFSIVEIVRSIRSSMSHD